MKVSFYENYQLNEKKKDFEIYNTPSMDSIPVS